MKARCPLVPYEPAIVKQYRPMSVRRSAFSVQRFGVLGVPAWCNHVEGESVPISLFIVRRKRALMVDGEKDGAEDARFPNAERRTHANDAKRRTSFAGHAVQLFDGFSVQHGSSSDGIDITFPERYDNGRYAIADQVRHRTADADKPINRQNQDKTNDRDRRYCLQSCGKDHDRRPRNTVCAFRSNQRIINPIILNSTVAMASSPTKTGRPASPANDKPAPNKTAKTNTCRMSPFVNASKTVVGIRFKKNR